MYFLILKKCWVKFAQTMVYVQNEVV